MNRTLSAGLFTLALGAGTFSQQNQAHALTCIDHLVSGLGTGCFTNVRSFELVTQRLDASWASYSSGFMFKTASGQAASLKDTNFNYSSAQNVTERFSGRVNSTCSSGSQDFAVNAADQHNITINPSTGVVTIVNTTWGFTSTLTATCNGEAIVANDGTSLYIITFTPTASHFYQCIT